MSNVLGELFGDIANAIREKTGDTATMKPAEFPDKIAAIETGGGTSENVVARKVALVTLSATWNQRVSIDFGFTPDFILINPDNNVSVSTSNFMYWGYSQKAKDNLGMSGASMGMARMSSGTFMYDYTSAVIESVNANTPINSTDETGFNIGKTPPAGTYWVQALKLC